MNRSIKELWEISKTVYNEMVFRTLMMQYGASVNDKESVEKVIKSSRSIIMLKIFLIIPILLMVIPSAFYAYDMFSKPSHATIAKFSIGFSSFLVFTIFIIFLASILQASIVFSGKLFEPLFPLDLTHKDLSKIAFLTLFKIFDIPVVSAALITLVSIFLATWNIFFAMAIFLLTVLFLLVSFSLLVYSGSKLATKIVTPQTSLSKSLARVLILLAYTLVFSLIYVIPTIMNQYLETIVGVVVKLDPSTLSIIYTIPPLSILFSLSLLATGTNLDVNLILPLISSLLTIFAALWSVVKTTKNLSSWLLNTILAVDTVKRGLRILAGDIDLNPSKNSFVGLLKKEFKIIMRNPNTALMMFFGPILLFVYYVMYIFLNMQYTFIESMTFFIATFLIMIAPNSIIAEGEGINYLLTLPLSERDIIKSKSIVLTLSYVIYAITVPILYSATASLTPAHLFFLPLTFGNFLGVYYTIKKTYKEMIKEGTSFFRIRGRLDIILYMFALAIIFFFVPMISFIAFISVEASKWSLYKLITGLGSIGLVIAYALWSIYLLLKTDKN